MLPTVRWGRAGCEELHCCFTWWYHVDPLTSQHDKTVAVRASEIHENDSMATSHKSCTRGFATVRGVVFVFVKKVNFDFGEVLNPRSASYVAVGQVVHDELQTKNHNWRRIPTLRPKDNKMTYGKEEKMEPKILANFKDGWTKDLSRASCCNYQSRMFFFYAQRTPQEARPNAKQSSFPEIDTFVPQVKRASCNAMTWLCQLAIKIFHTTHTKVECGSSLFSIDITNKT